MLIVAVVAIIIIVAAVAVVMMNNSANKDPSTPDQPDTPDTPDTPDKPDVPDTPTPKLITASAAEIAASFSANYSGFFGENFYIKEGVTENAYKAYYPNGNTSKYGSSDNYLTFTVYSSIDDAKGDFDINKADYQNNIGKTVMGGEVKGTTVNGGMTEAIGYYNNYNMGTPSTYLYYTAYYQNVFVEGYISLKNTSITGDTVIEPLAKAIFSAINNPVPVDKAKLYIPNPAEIAASFSANYSGFFGQDFYIKEGATRNAYKAYYPNGNTSQYGSSDNYLTFTVYDNLKDAKDDFDTNKADYQNNIGKTVMGGEVKGTTVNGGMTEAIGYYNNYNMGTPSTYLYYTAYYQTVFVEGYISLKNTSIAGDSDIEPLAKAIFDAVMHPISVDKAKQPQPDEPPAVDYKGVAKRVYEFTDEALKYGDYADAYSVTEDSTAMKATLQESSGKYYVKMQISSAEAANMYNTKATEIQGKIDNTAGSITYLPINYKDGVDGGIGLYYNAAMGSTVVHIMDYVCYKGSYYAEVHLRAAGDINEETATNMAKDLIAALTA